MAIPYTGLFIAASCNSRSSHGWYTRSSTEHLQYGAVTSARLLGQNYSNRNHTDKVRQFVFRYTFLPTQNNGTPMRSTRPIDPPHEPHGQASVNQGVAIATRGSVHLGCYYATALDIEVDPQCRRFGCRESDFALQRLVECGARLNRTRTHFVSTQPPNTKLFVCVCCVLGLCGKKVLKRRRKNSP
jgi:hypothetical protein